MWSDTLVALKRARRPVLVYGYGIRGAIEAARRLANDLAIPVAVTWGARDIFPDAIGAFGTHGTRAANLAVQNSDWLLAVGTRLDTKATGSPASSFAPQAVKFMVDVDYTEIDKFNKLGMELTGGYVSDAKAFLADMILIVQEFDFPDFLEWQKQCLQWKAENPIVKPEYYKDTGVNPYILISELDKYLKTDDTIVSDTGCALAWMMQAYKFKGERFIHAFNQTPMGYGLPAAIGAAFATGGRVVLITGDGGLAVNAGEFATIERHALPIKVLLFNNRGHAMCRQTQRQWLAGNYPATSYEGGLACPNWGAIAKAYGIRASSLKRWIGSDGLPLAPRALSEFMADDLPALLELTIDPEQGVYPQIKFGEPLA